MRLDRPLESADVFADIEGGGKEIVYLPANSSHFAYKGVVTYLVSEGVTSGVR